MELVGKILEIGTLQEISPKFRKRSLILETVEDKSPQVFEIEFINDRQQLLDKCNVGQMVAVGINLRGRKWTSPKGEDKYFTSIAGWRIQDSNAGGNSYPMPDAPPAAADDDIPF